MTLAETNTPSTWKRIKTTAVLLAIFLGPWTWIYTFKKDSWKATVGLAFNFGLLLLALLTWIDEVNVVKKYPYNNYDSPMIIYFVFLILLLAVITWLIAFIDTLIKKREWFITIENTQIYKRVSILLAIITGPWTWLYTYSKDRWKFYISIILSFGLPIMGTAIDYFGFVIIGAWAILTIWLFSIIEACVRKEKWYQSYPI